jgi:hypothetical protein
MGAGYGTSTTTTSYETRTDEYERSGVRDTEYATPAIATEQVGTVPVAASAGTVDVTRQGETAVCGREYFTKVGRPQGQRSRLA